METFATKTELSTQIGNLNSNMLRRFDGITDRIQELKNEVEGVKVEVQEIKNGQKELSASVSKILEKLSI